MAKVQQRLLSIGLALASLAHAFPQSGPFKNTTVAAEGSHIVGSIILDDIVSTCGSVNAARIEKAANDYHLLATAVQGISGDDPSWVKYFGTGWEGPKLGKKFFYVADNLFKAAQLSQPGRGPLVRITCNDPTSHCGEFTGAFTTEQADSEGVQTVTICPYAFSEDAGLKNIADLAQQGPPGNIRSLISYESLLLHEFMHLDNAGYITGLSWGSVGLNHITDVKARLSTVDETVARVYGPNGCKAYAASKQPPQLALANADSYTWLAVSKWASNVFGQTITKRDTADDIMQGLDETVPGGNLNFDLDDSANDPDIGCAAIGAPTSIDCSGITPDVDGSPDLWNNCPTDGSNKWCALKTNGDCSMSIGYDMGYGIPPLNNSVIAGLFNSHVANSGQDCNGVNSKQIAYSGCPSPGAGDSLCPVYYKFCLTRAGTECK